jgi:hypothetical protein
MLPVSLKRRRGRRIIFSGIGQKVMARLTQQDGKMTNGLENGKQKAGINRFFPALSYLKTNLKSTSFVNLGVFVS